MYKMHIPRTFLLLATSSPGPIPSGRCALHLSWCHPGTQLPLDVPQPSLAQSRLCAAGLDSRRSKLLCSTALSSFPHLLLEPTHSPAVSRVFAGSPFSGLMLCYLDVKSLHTPSSKPLHIPSLLFPSFQGWF